MEEINNKMHDIICLYLQKIEKYFAPGFEFVITKQKGIATFWTILYIKYSGMDTYVIYDPVDYLGVNKTILTEVLYNDIAKDILHFVRKIEGVE